MKKPTSFFTLMLVTVLLFSGCARREESNLPLADTGISANGGTGQTDALPDAGVGKDMDEEDEPVKPFTYPLYFPMPYYNVFCPEQTAIGVNDAFLHNSAVNYYLSRADFSRNGDLMLVSLRVLDEWDADGGIRYLCIMWIYVYDDLSAELIDSGGKSGAVLDSIAPFIVRLEVKNTYDNYEHLSNSTARSIEILDDGDGGIPEDQIMEICDGRPVAQLLLDPDTRMDELPYLRDILPEEFSQNPEAMVKQYMEVCFPEIEI